jgi:uncharacterized protein
MLSLLPDYADPLRLCGLGKVYEGTIALAELPRLAPLLTSNEGEAAFVLAFSMDDERRPSVRVEVRARLAVQCQRCLGPMWYEVASESRLGVVSGPDQAERLPADLEPLLVEDGRVALRSLIEDELILGIPPAPLHPEEDCAVSLRSVNAPGLDDGDGGEEKPNPFAALAALKGDSKNSD